MMAFMVARARAASPCTVSEDESAAEEEESMDGSTEDVPNDPLGMKPLRCRSASWSDTLLELTSLSEES